MEVDLQTPLCGELTFSAAWYTYPQKYICIYIKNMPNHTILINNLATGNNTSKGRLWVWSSNSGWCRIKHTTVQNTTSPICGASPKWHQYSNPDPTSDLTCHPYTNSKTLQNYHSNLGSPRKVFKWLTSSTRNSGMCPSPLLLHYPSWVLWKVSSC
jgi:hypothetical protein